MHPKYFPLDMRCDYTEAVASHLMLCSSNIYDSCTYKHMYTDDTYHICIYPCTVSFVIFLFIFLVIHELLICLLIYILIIFLVLSLICLLNYLVYQYISMIA